MKSIILSNPNFKVLFFWKSKSYFSFKVFNIESLNVINGASVDIVINFDKEKSCISNFTFFLLALINHYKILII